MSFHMPIQVFRVSKWRAADIAYELPGHLVVWFMRGPVFADICVSVLRLKWTSIMIIPESTFGFVNLGAV